MMLVIHSLSHTKFMFMYASFYDCIVKSAVDDSPTGVMVTGSLTHPPTLAPIHSPSKALTM